MNESYLLDNEGMRTRTDIPNWVTKEFQNFSSVVLEPTFPCYFGLTALKKNELRYSFLSHNDWSHLPHTMLFATYNVIFFRVNERAANCKKRIFPLCGTGM